MSKQLVKWSHVWAEADYSERRLTIKRDGVVVDSRVGTSQLGTYLDAYSDLHEDYALQKAQLAASAERERKLAEERDKEVERLREAFICSHNGDIQIKWNPDGFWAYGRDRDQSLVKLAGPCDEAVDAALAALAAKQERSGDE
jgi:hypothetical protein